MTESPGLAAGIDDVGLVGDPVDNGRSVPMASFQILLGLGLAHESVSYREIISRAA